MLQIAIFAWKIGTRVHNVKDWTHLCLNGMRLTKDPRGVRMTVDEAIQVGRQILSTWTEEEDEQMMHYYRLHWLGSEGKTEDISGTTIADAFTRAGYGQGALRALDWFDYIDRNGNKVQTEAEAV
jgi:hypothetical protein